MNKNELFPLFIKLDQIETLIVGAGNVGFEKLQAILKSSPNAKVTVVAEWALDDLKVLAQNAHAVSIIESKFQFSHLEGKQLVILATDDHVLHAEIKNATSQIGILTNVADTPDLCDFYLGSIVTKGDLKIGISTNGKSPTLSKRIRQFLEEFLPSDIQTLIDNLHNYRNTIKGDFHQKVKELNDVTSSILNKK